MPAITRSTFPSAAIEVKARWMSRGSGESGTLWFSATTSRPA